MMTRRSVFALAAGAVARAQSRPLRFDFGFSLYGMKTLPYMEGLGHVARIGYKSTEICLRPGWNTEAKLLTKSSRSDIRKRIGDLGLKLPSVMENLGLGRPEPNRQANLERLRTAAEVCYECSPDEPALIETTVGGRPAAWDEIKSTMADELAAWAKAAEQLKITVAIKAHSKTAMNLPERILWLADQVKSPRIKLAYDYSHYQVNRLDMRKTMEQVASRAPCRGGRPRAPATGRTRRRRRSREPR